MKYYCIKDGVIRNIIAANKEFVEMLMDKKEYDQVVRYDDKPREQHQRIGDKYDPDYGV